MKIRSASCKLAVATEKWDKVFLYSLVEVVSELLHFLIHRLSYNDLGEPLT